MGIIEWFKNRMICPMDLEIIEACKEDVEFLEKAHTLDIQVEKDVERVCEGIKDDLVRDYLGRLDVEEINRERLGIRISLLKKNGYQTILDLSKENVMKIASINGISDEGARLIVKKVHQMVDIAYEECRLRLSVDNKNEKTNNLIHLLDIKRQMTIVFSDLSKLKKIYKEIKVGKSSIHWFFRGKVRKKETLEYYETFRQLMLSDYGKRMKEYKAIFYHVLNISVDDSWNSFAMNPYPFYSCLEKIYPNIIGADHLKTYGLPNDLALKVKEEPLYLEGLKCELRAYQVWGVKYILCQKRVLLGDEMGLGKTIQAIASMVSLHNCGKTHFMVVCPASVLANWIREIIKMSNLSVFKIHGHEIDTNLELWKKQGGVAVTTYETINKIELVDLYDLLVVDEAHYVKNPEAIRTRNIIRISEKTLRILFMTGTAIENNVDEMIRLISILQPLLTKKIKSVAYLSTAERFKELIAPVYYRRKREDVLVELPDLIEKEEWCTLNNQELEKYKSALVSHNFTNVRRVSMDVDYIYDSSKVQRLMEIVSVTKDQGRKVIVFSYFLKTIERLMEVFPNGFIGPITGAVSSDERQRLIDDFNQAEYGTVLLAQMIAGGTGLNVQSASVVVLMEPQLKPSIENQAISRAYRMGQTRNVYVYRLLMEDTIEQKMMERLENKQLIFDAFADKSVMASHEITEQSLKEMIEEEIEEKNYNKEKVR